MQRKKVTDESSSLTEQITKLEQLLSTRANILKVTYSLFSCLLLFFWLKIFEHLDAGRMIDASIYVLQICKLDCLSPLRFKLWSMYYDVVKGFKCFFHFLYL